MTFDTAVAYCKYFDSKIVKIESTCANKYINQLALNDDVGYYWIDGRDSDKEGVFVDLNNKTLKYTNWRPGQPDNYFGENCIHVIYNANGVWNDIDCEDKYSTMCESVGTVNYYYTKTAMSFDDSIIHCKNKGMKLVQIKNLETNKIVNEYALKYNLGKFWIDGNDMQKEGEFVDQDNKILSYANWKPGQPDNNDGENCIYVISDNNAFWDDADCHNRYSTICEALESPYEYSKLPMKYDLAVAYCKKRKMKVVKIKDAQNNKLITDFALKNNLDSFWINGNDRSKKGVYIDTDNNSLSYTNWMKGQPDSSESEDCIHVLTDQNGVWNDISCTYKNYVICETSESAYDFTKYKMTFASAEAYCKNKGMKIITIKNAEMNKIVNDLALKNKVGWFWMNGNDIANEGEFVDTDNIPLVYKNWKVKQPDDFLSEDCILVHPDENGIWTDASCDFRYSVICQTPDNLYEFSRTQMTFDEALVYCLERDMELLKIENAQTNNFVNDLALRNTLGSFWINGNDRAKEGDFVDSEHFPLKYTNWKKGEPNNYYTENCVEILSAENGVWNDIDCYSKFHAICESMDNSFEFSKTPMTFDAALTYCRNRGMKLARVKSAAANKLVNDFAVRNEIRRFWIDANDIANEGVFVDSNNKQLIYTNWKVGQPDNYRSENCIYAVSTQNGAWKDVYCRNKFPVICEPSEPSYEFGKDPMSFASAVLYCKSIGMSLITIENEETNKIINDLALKRNLESFWIDGNDDAKEGLFVDSNNRPLSYHNWKAPQPNNFETENCIQIITNQNGYWNDVDCFSKCSVICYKK